MSALSPATIGVLVGLVFAVLDNLLIRVIIKQATASGKAPNVSALRLIGASAFIVFPVLGYFIGPMVVH